MRGECVRRVVAFVLLRLEACIEADAIEQARGQPESRRRGEPLLEDNATIYVVTFSLPRETMM